MVTQHYRWDFIGLSTDEKPTPETSEKVVDGSTYYESDTSKLFIFFKDTWYEKESTSGGDSQIYTAGENITIEDGVISASGAVKELTASDYNVDLNSDGVNDVVVLPLLPNGVYSFNPSSISIKITRNSADLISDNGYTAVVMDVNYSYQKYRGILLIGGGAKSTSRPNQSLVLIYTNTSGTTEFDRITYLDYSQVINNLTTTSAYNPLSANQGKILNDKITALENRISALEGN